MRPPAPENVPTGARRTAHEKQAIGCKSQIACHSKLWGIPQVLTFNLRS
jgi:hypothetical protein